MGSCRAWTTRLSRPAARAGRSPSADHPARSDARRVGRAGEAGRPLPCALVYASRPLESVVRSLAIIGVIDRPAPERRLGRGCARRVRGGEGVAGSTRPMPAPRRADLRNGAGEGRVPQGRGPSLPRAAASSRRVRRGVRRRRLQPRRRSGRGAAARHRAHLIVEEELGLRSGVWGVLVAVACSATRPSSRGGARRTRPAAARRSSLAPAIARCRPRCSPARSATSARPTRSDPAAVRGAVGERWWSDSVTRLALERARGRLRDAAEQWADLFPSEVLSTSCACRCRSAAVARPCLPGTVGRMQQRTLGRTGVSRQPALPRQR